MGFRSRHVRLALTATVLVSITPAVACAGMPSLMLTDLARLRVQSISFFLLLLLASAFGVMKIWNSLRRDFVRLPKLRFGPALGMVSLWGMLFLLVLTMISGARELMTPGAWDKQGVTYRLTTRPAVVTEAERLAHLLVLKAALSDYAAAHDGAYPPDDRTADIASKVWESSDVTRMRYIYIPGRKAADGGVSLACEPAVFSPPRLVLTADGQIRTMAEGDLPPALAPQVRQ